jgi:hypothetical protein
MKRLISGKTDLGFPLRFISPLPLGERKGEGLFTILYLQWWRFHDQSRKKQDQGGETGKED